MTALYILITILIILSSFTIYNYFRQKKISISLTTEEFIKGYRKAQLIDIREEKDFKTGHILGAKNVPVSQFRFKAGALRTDMPVYLYDQNGMKCPRACQMLFKKGHRQLYYLQGGFKNWTGKIRK